MNKFSFVELYAKCVKEGHIEWTRPEKAIETTKNAWQKAKLRLVMLSAGAIIEITCSKVKYYVIFYIRLYAKCTFVQNNTSYISKILAIVILIIK